ncbi:MAG: Gfo/Idh/MocA family oxidoreductase [Roseburia sp.]|nr:Gfo/Idh/MocA family oxidoreductase [Roseburia sp.]MCM1242087.1 Gfo/Idh/MocA family oxidoreductase [Roseburia sp.]
MEKIKLGIIGMGNMGSGHLQNILDGKCPSVEVTAIADTDMSRLEQAKEKAPAIKCFQDALVMLDSGLINAVLIAVPHYDHPKYATAAFARHIHVLIEKPAGVYTRQVREMNEAAKQSGVKFGIMLNQRTDPLFQKAYEIVHGGKLGELKRMVWIITNWYRTQAYYDSGNWRATWSKEGGGVLLNQAPHNLDLWQWICGMPNRIRAYCSIGKYHNIAVEDDVTIYGEYENGMTAVFISSTGETPGTNRLEISGTLGKIVLEDGKLTWWKLPESEREICFSQKEGFYVPETTVEEFTARAVSGHPLIIEDFAKAVINNTPMLAPGEEGINSLMISNAAYLSSWLDKEITLPVDEKLFESHLSQLCQKENI